LLTDGGVKFFLEVRDWSAWGAGTADRACRDQGG
jgi:hypothetical protein